MDNPNLTVLYWLPTGCWGLSSSPPPGPLADRHRGVRTHPEPALADGHAEPAGPLPECPRQPAFPIPQCRYRHPHHPPGRGTRSAARGHFADAVCHRHRGLDVDGPFPGTSVTSPRMNYHDSRRALDRRNPANHRSGPTPRWFSPSESTEPYRSAPEHGTGCAPPPPEAEKP